MGHIDRFNLELYITYFKTKTFVETGTGHGSGLKHALRYDFDKLYTIEIVEEIYNKVKGELEPTNPKCTFINNNSKDGLIEVLTNISAEENVCFWLDAHFPGADFGLVAYGTTKDESLRIPLESEMRVLKEIRDTKNDVFIIDDLRIYEDGPYGGGNWLRRRELGGNGIGFITELFSETHDIKRDFRDQGYIILLPKDVLVGDIHLGSK